MTAVLDDIIRAARRRAEHLTLSQDVPPRRAASDFRAALAASSPAFIAEIKRASPSRGVLRNHFDIVELARAYRQGGAAAISVLTEPDFFRGSNEDFARVAAAVDLPLLRKDFLVSEVQVRESALLGASAVLLIAAVLAPGELRDLRCLAEEELGLAALVEVHTPEEMAIAISSGATLIGINNRDLRTFQVSLDTCERLAGLAPRGVTLVAESGIRSADDVRRLQAAGIHAFLVGESLMTAADPASKLRALRGMEDACPA